MIYLIASLIFLTVPAYSAVQQPVTQVRATDVINLATEKSLDSIESLISLLPIDFRKNFTLVQSSQSLQGASASSPRAILWSDQGDFALSFNGDPDQRAYDAIEMMQFDSANQKFHFIELKMKDSVSQNQWVAREPKTCLQCHGPNPRPIWQEYPTWKNSFGSKDDFFADGELSIYQNFVTAAQTHPRFQFLFKDIKPEENSPNFPYRPDEINRSTNLATAFIFRPNLRLGHLLLRENAQRIFSMMKSSPNYKDQAQDLLAAVMNCTAGGEDFPYVLANLGLKKADFDIRNRFDEPSNDLLNFRLSYFDGSATILEYVAALLAADISKFKARGLMDKFQAPIARNMLDWPLFKVLDEKGGWLSLPYVRNNFTEQIQKREPFTAGYHQQFTGICSSLRLNPSVNQAAQTTPRTGKQIVHDRCSYCHSSGEHRFTVDDEAVLQKTLKSNPKILDLIQLRTDPTKDPEFRMPFLGTALTAEERNLVLNYFKSLIQ